MSANGLPITAFEHLMLLQDSPEYPCVIFTKIRLLGNIDHSAFEQALQQMLDRHPLLRSRIDSSRAMPVWREQSSSDIPIEWRTDSVDHAWLSDSRHDLASSPGTRVIVHEQADESTIIFQTHHASVDGLGVLNAIHEVWILYDALVKQSAPQLPPVNIQALPKRNSFGLTPRSIFALIPKQLVGLLGVRQYLMRKPVPILPHQPFINDRSQPLPVTTQVHRFSAAESKSLRSLAAKQGASLNELIATSIFQSVSAFRDQRGVQQETDWLRMMVPISMRTSSADMHQSACNIVSCVFLDRTPDQIANRASLLASIHTEMELIKKNRLAFMFNFSLWVQKKLTRGRIQADPPKRCQTSVVFTNLGKLHVKSPLMNEQGKLRSGGLMIEDIQILAPLTPHMAIAFSASIYGGELSLVLRYDPRVLDRDSSVELLNGAVTNLQKWANEFSEQRTTEAVS